MQFRKDPIRGEVIAIPLGEDRWAYICFFNDACGHLYNFVSNGLVKDLELWRKENWLMRMEMGFLPRTFPTVCHIEVTDQESRPRYIADIHGRFFVPTGVDSWREVPAGEAKQLPIDPYCSYENFPAFIESYREQMTVVQGDPSIVPSEAEAAEERTVDFELDYLGDDYEADVDDCICDEAGYEGVELESMCGYCCRCAAEDASQALAVIRKGLKKAVPKADWGLVQIVRRGPKNDQERTYGILPAKRKATG